MMGQSEMIVHNTVYHQQPGRQPGGVVHRYSQLLESPDPPFELPKLILTESWQPLPCGHVREVKAFVILNEEGTFPHVIPTDEERDLVSQRVVEVSLRARLSPDLGISPGCSEKITPVYPDPNLIHVRARRGRITCWLMVIPR